MGSCRILSSRRQLLLARQDTKIDSVRLLQIKVRYGQELKLRRGHLGLGEAGLNDEDTTVDGQGGEPMLDLGELPEIAPLEARHAILVHALNLAELQV